MMPIHKTVSGVDPPLNNKMKTQGMVMRSLHVKKVLRLLYIIFGIIQEKV